MTGYLTPAQLRTKCQTENELGHEARIHTTHPSRDFLVIDNEIVAWADKEATA